MRRPAALLLAAGLAALAAVAPARPAAGQPAGPDDYDLASTSWKGLSTLEALADGMGLEVLQVSGVDWDEIERGDVLFLLYPTRRVEPAHLNAFVRNGGRVLLADDFGRTEDALAGLGILRGSSAAAQADEFWDDQPFAPVARPLSGHPLAENVAELVTNHPAVWRTMRGPQPVLGFSDGSAIVAALEQGDGRLVALSDPSVLINRMLEFDGNLAFAINLVRWLSRPGETRRLIIMTGDLTLYGEPSRVLGEAHPRGSMGGLLDDFNAWLVGLNDYLLADHSMRAVAIATAFLVSILALLALPRVKRGALDGSWTRARGGEDSASPERLVSDLDRRGRRASFALPAAVLRDSVNARLATLTGTPDPLYAVPEAALVAAVAQKAGPAAAGALQALYPLLRGLPTRAQAASPWQAPHTPQRDFERMSLAADQLYRSLGD